MVIWRIPEPVQGSSHHYKYRLFYGRGGKRIVGYDNERPKGDHRHIEGQGEHVQFNTLDTLIEEFLAEVKAREEVWKRQRSGFGKIQMRFCARLHNGSSKFGKQASHRVRVSLFPLLSNFFGR